MEKVTAAFFERDPLVCARDLVGATFVWKGCHGRIVETEAYDSMDDPACHTWTRPSTRKFVESHFAGDAYVYLNYGTHWLFNVLVKGPHSSGFVLFRALEPVLGLERMRERRGPMDDRMLASGPGKLTRALGIDGTIHGADFLSDNDCGILRGTGGIEICSGPRVGISRAMERHWRFGDAASRSLSRRF